MRFPCKWYWMRTTLPHYLPHLRSAQGRGLALWVYGTTLAQSACQNAVIAALLAVGDWHDSSAIPVAWHVLPANQPGALMPHILRLLGPAVPPTMQVVVLADQGLSSPRLWKHIRDLCWHLMVSVHNRISFHPLGKRRLPARQLVPVPGRDWVCRGVAFGASLGRHQGTLVVVWAPHRERPWVVLTDVPPERVGICWYGLRVWIEFASCVLKGVGWQWQQTRRTEPTRVARHWLVLAVATFWVLPCGTRVEDAAQQGLPFLELARPRRAPGREPRARGQQRCVGLFRQGHSWLRVYLLRGRLWRRLWLAPASRPEPTPQLHISCRLFQQVA